MANDEGMRKSQIIVLRFRDSGFQMYSTVNFQRYVDCISYLTAYMRQDGWQLMPQSIKDQAFNFNFILGQQFSFKCITLCI